MVDSGGTIVKMDRRRWIQVCFEVKSMGLPDGLNGMRERKESRTLPRFFALRKWIYGSDA